jgi:hypothetical protein
MIPLIKLAFLKYNVPITSRLVKREYMREIKNSPLKRKQK